MLTKSEQQAQDLINDYWSCKTDDEKRKSDLYAFLIKCGYSDDEVIDEEYFDRSYVAVHIDAGF